MKFWVVIVGLWLALLAPALGQDHPLKGVALVIGESKYEGLVPALSNPRNDARAMDDMLSDLGFEVTRVLDGDKRKLDSEIADFVATAKGADVALVYYSGHGIEAGGSDFLVPVDADLATPQQAGEDLIAVDGLLGRLSKTVPVTIMLLDACRTNGLPAGTLIQPPGASAPLTATESGLAVVRGPNPVLANIAPDQLGTVIGFAASPGQSALDGAPGDANSPYAAALLKHLGAGGYSFGDLMTMVSEEVYLRTKARQLPWVNSSLRRVLTFGTPLPAGDADDVAIAQGRRQLLLSIASSPEATRGTVETIAKTEGVPLDALYGMLKVLGVDTSAGSADLEQQLQEGARRLKSFKEQELGTGSSDADLTRLAGLAKRAQDEGAIDLALKYREQATARARVLAGERDQLEAGLKADRIVFGATFAQHAQTAALNFDYATSAQMFGEAFDQVAKWDADLAVSYKWQQAGALRDYGDFKGDNGSLTKAIATYREALLLAPRESKPDIWVSIDNDLGWALYTLGSRDSDSARLNEAITTLQTALDASLSVSAPSDIAVTRLNLGNALSTLGERESDPARLRAAVAVFTQALRDLPRETDPYNWGKIEFNLASTLRLLGERESGTDTLLQSVAAFDASIAVITRELSPLEWALAQNNYATVLFALGQRSNNADYLHRAADALNLALQERREDVVPLDWAMSESNLGNVYVALSSMTGDPAALNQGVAAYRAGLRQLKRETAPLLWATAQSNLGVALTALFEANGDRTQLADAVAAFNLALEARTQQTDAPNWAMTQLNLSGALEELGRDEVSAEHLLAAVDAADASLTVWTRQNDPLAWAKAHYALGNAWLSLGDRAQDTDAYGKAAASYEQALLEFRRDAMPPEWLVTTKRYALTLQNWGERETGLERLSAAVAQWRLALAASPLADNPREFGRINFNLGLCLENLDDRGQAGVMDAAIAAFRAALGGYTREQFPADWADTQLRLGFALHAQASKTDGATDGIRQAIAAYEAAQEIKTRETDPFSWAELENYIGSAYGLLGVRTSDKAALIQGRDDLAAAWAVYKSRDDSYDDDFKQRLGQFDAAIQGMS